LKSLIVILTPRFGGPQDGLRQDKLAPPKAGLIQSSPLGWLTRNDILNSFQQNIRGSETHPWDCHGIWYNKNKQFMRNLKESYKK
jgi:hypothetical protein